MQNGWMPARDIKSVEIVAMGLYCMRRFFYAYFSERGMTDGRQKFPPISAGLMEVPLISELSL